MALSSASFVYVLCCPCLRFFSSNSAIKEEKPAAGFGARQSVHDADQEEEQTQRSHTALSYFEYSYSCAFIVFTSDSIYQNGCTAYILLVWMASCSMKKPQETDQPSTGNCWNTSVTFHRQV